MIRVLLNELPKQIPIEVIGQNTVDVGGEEMHALYFNNDKLAVASSLGGVVLITE